MFYLHSFLDFLSDKNKLSGNKLNLDFVKPCTSVVTIFINFESKTLQYENLKSESHIIFLESQSGRINGPFDFDVAKP